MPTQRAELIRPPISGGLFIGATIIADIAEIGFRVDSSGLDKGAKSLEKLDKAGEKAEKRGAALGKAFGASAKVIGAIGVATTGALKLYKDFGGAIAEVSSLLGDSFAPDAIDTMADSVRDLAKEFGGSATEQANALYQVISAGASSAAEATDILTAANKLAIGGVSDINTAADGLTSAINAYASSGLTAADASDSLFTAVKAGKTTIGELSGVMGKVGPLASTLGVSFDEMNAALATITTTGASTSEAATGLTGILKAVIKPTKEASDTAAELGLNFTAAALESQGLAGFLEQVATKTGGSSVVLGQLFGDIEGLKSVMSITGEQAGTFADILGSMAEKSGATDAAFGKLTTGLGGLSFQWEKLKSNAGDALLTLGEQAAPIVTELLTTINEIDFSAAITAFFDFTGSAIETISNLPGEVVGYVEDTVDGMILALIELIAEGERIALDFIDGFVKGISGGIKAAVDKATELATSVADSVKGFFGIQSPSKLMQEYGVNVSEGLALGITDGSSQAIQAAVQLADDVVNSFDDMADRTRESVSELSTEIGKAGEAATDFSDLYETAFDDIITITGDGELQVKSFGDIWDDVKSNVLGAIGDIISKGINALIGSILGLKDLDIGSIFSGLFGGEGGFDFSGLIKNVTGGLSNVVSSIGSVLTGGLGGVVSKISGIFTGGFGGVLTKAAGLANAAGSAIIGSLGSIASVAGPVALGAAAVYGLVKAFSGGRSSSEIMRDEVRQLSETISTGTSEVFKLAGGFEAAGAAGAHFITGQNLESLQQYLDGIDGINTRLQEVDGSPVLRVLDDMGRGVVDLDTLIKGHTDSMTGEFKAFGESASLAGDGIRDSFVGATGLMTQAITDMATTSDQKAGDIETSFSTASTTIAGAARDASSVIDSEFTSAANTIRSESTSAAGILESQIKGGAQGAGQGVAGFVSGANQNLDALIRKAKEAAAQIKAIGEGGGGDRAGGSSVSSFSSNVAGRSAVSSVDSRPEMKEISRKLSAQISANDSNTRKLESKLEEIEKRLAA